jgi:hypothetical protein
VSLRWALIFEISFPNIDSCWTIFKYEAIPLFPNVSGCNYEDFHEEVVTKILFGSF